MRKLILIFMITQVIYTQTPPFYNYTSTNGLSSSTVFDIIQDKNGYIWIATINGLSRFDGKKFINYGIKDGLNSTTIVSVIEGVSGEIYIANLEKGINLLKDGVITGYTSTDTKIYRIGDLFYEKNKLYAHSVDSYFNVYNEGMSEVVVNLSNLSKNKINLTNKVRKVRDGSFWALTSNGIYRIENNKLNKINIDGINDKEIFNLFEDKNGNIYLGGKGIIYVINNYKVIETIKAASPDDIIYTLFRDSGGHLWYSILNKGFRVIYAGTNKIFDISAKLKIPKAPINKFIEDKENNIWVSTFGKGVFCLNNLFINNYNEDNGLSNNNVQAFEKDNHGRLIIGTYNGLNILDDGKFQNITLGYVLTDYIYGLQFLNNKIYVSTVLDKVHFIPKKNIYGLDLVFFSNPSLCISKDTTYILGAWGNNFFKSKNLTNIYNNEFKVLGNEFINNRINKIFEDSESNLWFGTTLGLAQIKEGVKQTFSDNKVLNSSVNSILEDGNKKIWFACENGIANYDLNTFVVNTITDFQGYDFSASSSIVLDKDNRLWIGTKRGLFRLERNALKFFNSQTGLPSNEILSLFYDKDRNFLWVGTSNGFSSLDIAYYDKYRPQELGVVIEYVKTEDSIYTNFNDLKFEPDNNNIYISFSAQNFSSPGTVTFQYKLEDNWIETEEDHLEFSSIKEGTYNLVLRAKTHNSGWGNPSSIFFTVKPKFTDTIWFMLLMFCTATGIIYAFAKYRIFINKKKSIEKVQLINQINELKHRAVSALMNPHFVFNALSSVQYLVNMNKTKEANDYISQMASLFRKNLDLATEDFISLHEEIIRLKLYLDIERLRFGEKLSYDFLVDKQIDPELIELPNMIIQPFVENSIIHGILEMAGPGLIQIAFNFENLEINNSNIRCFVIRITDNGIGVSASRNVKKKGHTSRAIEIIKERLTLLSQDLGMSEPIIISDLSERAPGSCGTEVVLTLPPPLYKINIY